MSALYPGVDISPEDLRLLLLAYGLDHAFRVIGFDEIARSMPHVNPAAIKAELDRLAEDALVTRFSGRYCFNKAVPVELRHEVERFITPSGTIRAVRRSQPQPD